jgi:PIN domain nuclease of toxin-antitoxin system
MDTLQVNIHEARTQLSKIIQAALNGKLVIIAKGNKPAVRLEVLPFYQRDPFDRRLIAQAMVEDMRLLSRDHRLSGYNIERVW